MTRAASLVCLFALVLSVGCGDDSSSTSSSSSSSSSSSAPSAPTMSSTTDTSMTDTTMSTPGMESSTATAESTSMYDSTMTSSDPAMAGYTGNQQQQPQMSKRPKDAGDWTTNDITTGIVEGDRVTVQAIREFARRMEGKPEAVAQIMNWLQTLDQTSLQKGPNFQNQPGAQPGYSDPYSIPSSNPSIPNSSGQSIPNSSGQSIPGSSGPGASLDFRTPGHPGHPNRFVNLLVTSTVSWQGELSNPAYSTESSSYDAMMSGQQPGQTTSPSVQNALCDELIAALVATRTLEGYTSVREILKGKVLQHIPDDKVVLWTISALMKNIDGPYSPAKKILYQTLMEPELFRPATSPVPERYNAAELAKQSLLLHVAFSEATLDGFMGIPEGKAPKPGQNPNPTQNNYDSTMTSADPMQSNPNANLAPAANAAPSLPKIKVPHVTMTPEQARGAANYFWDQQLHDFSSGQLQRVARFGQSPEAFLLVGQIPSTAIRDQLRTMITENWEQDPAWLIEQRVFRDHWRDPGLIVLLKSLDREPRPLAQANQDGSQPNAARRPSRDKDTPAQKTAKYGWYDASEQFVLATMDRLAAASQGEGATAHNNDELDIRIHKGAGITAECRLQFPPANDDIGIFSHLEPTTVNYVRIESTEMDEKTAKHYESAIRNEEKRTILGNNAIWFDGGLRRDRTTGLVTCTDIILSQNNARGRISANASGQPQATSDPASAESYNAGTTQQGPGGVFVVEIMTITIPDPTAKPATPAAVSERN